VTGVIERGSGQPAGALEAPATRRARPRLAAPARLGAWLWAAATVALAAALAAGLVWGFVSTATPVAVAVDGLHATVLTHQATVGELLDEMEVVLSPEDRLDPPRATPLERDMEITIQRARPVLVDVDSRLRLLRTQATSVDEVLAEAGIAAGSHDELVVDGQPGAARDPLPARALAGARRLPGIPAVYPWRDTTPALATISLRRAAPLEVAGAGIPSPLWTTATTIGEALHRAGVVLYEGDLVQPALAEPVSAGARVVVERSLPVTLATSSGELGTRSRRATVADLLSEQGLVLSGLDRIEPPLATPLSSDLRVQITRVERRFEVEEDVTKYETVWEPDPELEIDNVRLDQEGANGITRYRYTVTLEDGQPISRTLQDVWLAQAPVTQVHNYGSGIVMRQLETAAGPQTYWRKIRMFATSYTPATSGTPRDAPWYGRTRIGLRAGFGVVAVDPAVVRLGSRVYVPGYGVAIAGDTGGGVVGRWIDLGYDDGAAVGWGRCVDVYVLGEPPPSYLIRYRLPATPQVACLRG
jgi:uncharacterized protein YabE (DUF348 family)